MYILSPHLWISLEVFSKVKFAVIVDSLIFGPIISSNSWNAQFMKSFEMLPIYQKFRLSHTFIFSSLSPDLINKYRLSKLNNIKLVVNSLSKGTWNIQTFSVQKCYFFVYRTFYVFGRYKKSQMYDMRSHSNHVSCLIALYYCQHI